MPVWNKILTKKFLINLYINQQLSSIKIAKKIGCCSTTILLYLIKHRIIRRKPDVFRKGTKHSLQTKLKISTSNKNTKSNMDCTGENNPFYNKHHTLKTKNKIRQSKYHNNLSGKNNPNYGNHILKNKYIGKDSANWKGGLPKCKICGDTLSHYRIKNYCKKCYRGENHYNYIHGKGNFPYPLKFNNKLKLKIRKRDKFTCQRCGLKEKNHLRGNKHVLLIIHHIDYNKDNCKDNNLITVCNKCNLKANTNIDYWYAFYTYIMENKNA